MRAFAEAWPDLAILQRSVAPLPWRHHVALSKVIVRFHCMMTTNDVGRSVIRNRRPDTPDQQTRHNRWRLTDDAGLDLP